MPKKKAKSSDAPATAPSPAGSRRYLWRWLAHGLVGVVLLGSCAWGFYYAREYVDQTVAPAVGPPAVVFLNRPKWMSDRVARQLADSFRPKDGKSVFDHEFLVRTTNRLRANPWIAQLRQVRRVYDIGPGDTLEVDCDFRSPMALVRAGSDYWFVDAHGVKLPERFVAADLPKIMYADDGSMNVRVIEGVQQPPPAKAGETWVGQDLSAGLELVGRLYGWRCAEEIVRVDVANFNGRVNSHEAQIVLRTKYDSQIRWGRPWSAPDAFVEVSPEQKMRSMARVLAEYGRVDGRQPWIDIRFDRLILCPDDDTEANDSR